MSFQVAPIPGEITKKFRRNFLKIEIFGTHLCKNEYATCHPIPRVLITDLLLTVVTKETLVNNKYFVHISLEQ